MFERAAARIIVDLLPTGWVLPCSAMLLIPLAVCVLLLLWSSRRGSRQVKPEASCLSVQKRVPGKTGTKPADERGRAGEQKQRKS